jgi:serine/threonine-protein kinase HipA
MSLPLLEYCPSTLQPGFTTYSGAGQQALFGGRAKKVSPILSFGPPGKSSELTHEYNEKRKRMSISGVQEKYSLLLTRNSLSLTAARGTHILKPVSTERLELVADMPANEHVSMQIARQVYGIKTAACGMIFFNDGSPAYITRRFDYKPEGDGKYQIEDFASLLGKSPEAAGNDYKYNASYLDIARLIPRYVAAAPVALLEFFRLVVFNYLIGNGDAHLKNFSLMETAQGDLIFSPAYDLLCTALHINDSRLALHDGLYEGDIDERGYQAFGTYTRSSFLAFAELAGINHSLAADVVDDIMQGIRPSIELVKRSFLSSAAKNKYIAVLGERHRSLGLM